MRAPRAAVPLLLAACTPELPERYQVIDGRAGSYALVEAPIPELTDPRRMRGDLGDGRVGGWLDADLRGAELRDPQYAGGGAITLELSVQDGVGVPLHADGLELLSYYHALSALRAELDALGVSTEAVFPVPFAYQPSLGGIVLSSNAAYVGGGAHLFVLVPGGPGFEVPLAANPGVIRHEFGHALFTHLVGGDVRGPAPHIQRADVSALNEGFADLLGGLTLDDPDFIGLSVDLGGARDLRGRSTLATAAPVDQTPYGRGTVYASFAWDLRVASGDPDHTLRCALDALADWTADRAWEQDQPGVDSWAARMADRVLADLPALEAEVCAAYRFRFPGLPDPARCP